jgi:NADPH2 dehydrogenase
LLHEFLSARTRPGRFGGDFEGRTRLLFTIIQRVQETYPDLQVLVRVSIFDSLPYKTSREVGQPMEFAHLLPYQFAFGANPENPLESDLSEGFELLRRLQAAGVRAVNVSCGSPYYNPHIQRPAIFPPSDGYQPPEDPLVGVVRQIQAARACKAAVPGLPLVGTGYSYLQDYLPQVAQAVVRAGWIDLVGLGRMVLSYPDLPAETLAGGTVERKKVCRTFSDCTTAPRNALASGCYPLDPFYKARPEAETLKRVKQELK